MEEKKGFFGKLVAGLSKTRDTFTKNIESLFMGVSEVDESFYEELEEILIMGDLGVETTEAILDELRAEIEKRHLMHPDDLRGALIDILKEELRLPEDAYAFEDVPSIVFVIGVNGVGKTTSIGKLSHLFRERGKRVLLGACDTFRAAAIEQLEVWANRSQVPMISQSQGSDPSAVLFDALNSAKAHHSDILIVDTAGRLHNKKNLMEELKKMNRIIEQNGSDYRRENLLVLDASTGQNAISQAREFIETADITGIILTKMDGTAKGGMAIAIQNILHIPVKYIGVGEGINDLQRFNADEFVDALFSKTE